MKTHTLLSVVAITLGAAGASAQVPGLTVPRPSPAAGVTQTVGLTEVTVRYHRPSVNKRKVWGELVPYGEPWRAGANENTTVTFSTAVKLDGKELAAGTYGLHMIPTEKDWTVALSRVSTAWGSFTYDPKEDALRVTVTPRRSPVSREQLEYGFDAVSATGATLVLRWEALEVPVAFEVNTPEIVRASIRGELRGVRQYNWQPWNGAARYWLASGGDLDEAIRFADRSIAMQETYQNLSTKAQLLEKKGDAKGAAAIQAKAASIATEADINQQGYQLLGQGKVDEAIAVFQRNVKNHPKSWNALDSLGEAQLAKGDRKGAAASYGKALSMVKDETQRKRIEGVLARIKAGK
jgi:hypothetical protein